MNIFTLALQHITNAVTLTVEPKVKEENYQHRPSESKSDKEGKVNSKVNSDKLADKSKSEQSKKSDKKFDLAVGGQALIEGVMMRTPRFITMAIRRPNGEIHRHDRAFTPITKKYKILGLPIIRGFISFFEMMIVGTKALNYSAEIFMEDETKETKEVEKTLSSWYLAVTIVISLVFALFLFKFVPLWLAYAVEKHVPIVHEKYMLFNLVDGAIKITILIVYIAIISLMPDIKRVFEYHGAEHKSIFTYEKSEELIPENATKNSRFHPRCGTSFILIVFVISIFVYTFIPRADLFVVTLLQRISMLPVIAGISYEFLKWSAKHQKNRYALALSTPGLWLQRLTTRDPDLEQLEVGLESLKLGLKLEDSKE